MTDRAKPSRRGETLEVILLGVAVASLVVINRVAGAWMGGMFG